MFEHYDGRNRGTVDQHLYCLYLITLNGKKYVGQTNYTTARFSKHRTTPGCTYFYNSIHLYGWENANVEILLVDLTLEEANRLETHYIDISGTLAPDGYNLKRGGDSHEWSDEAREALSETMKSKWEEQPSMKEAQRMVMKKLWEDPDFIEATRLSLDKFWSDEARDAQREKMKIQWEDPEYRKAHTEMMKSQWENPEYREAQCGIFSTSQKKRYEKEEERENARKSHAHMRKFTDEELVEMNDNFKGSVGKLSAYFGISQCVISRHKKRLGLSGKCYNK